MDVYDSIFIRLESQLDILPTLVSRLNERSLIRRPTSGTWSVHENLAHLARYHEVAVERIKRILAEESPALDRYSAEDDPQWVQWKSRSPKDVLSTLTALRNDLIRFVIILTPDDLLRIGVHPTMGAMSLRLWLEFFLFHEGHHLYAIMRLLPRTESCP